MHPAQIQQLLIQAREEHQRSNLIEAEALYRQAIDAFHADHPDACQGLALVCFQLHHRQEALQWMRRAIAAASVPAPELLHTLGAMLMACGQAAEAVAVFERAVALKPEQPESHNNLGNALRQSG